MVEIQCEICKQTGQNVKKILLGYYHIECFEEMTIAQALLEYKRNHVEYSNPEYPLLTRSSTISELIRPHRLYH